MSKRLRAFCVKCACTLGSAACLFVSVLAFAAEVIPPKLKEQPAAEWPSASAEVHDVLVPLLLTVGADGSVVSVEVEGSISPEFDAAAIAAAKQWKFEPALHDGVPVAARIRALVRIVPPAPTPPPAPPAKATQTKPAVTPGLTPQGTAAPVAPTTKPAAEKPEAAAPAEAPVEILVTGRSQPPPRGTSDYVVPVGELSRVPRRNATEMLKLAPGIHLTNEGGEGHAERVYLRGFDAREGQDVELTFGGVPINESGNLHGNGFADLHFMIPELVLSLRVLEGPFDPRQGNYAVAGSADFEPGLRRRGLTAKYTRGSFDTERLLLTWGPIGESVHTFGGAQISSTDGFGQNRDARSAAAIGQYEGRIAQQGTWRLSGAAYANEYHSAGVLREQDVLNGRKGFFDTYDPRQGGSGSRFQLAADVESKSGELTFYQQLFGIRRGMRLRENFTGFLLDTQQAVQTPHAQRGDLFDLDMDETTLGARGFARTYTTLLGERQELELGYFARGDHVHGVRQRIESASGVPYKTETDLESQLADIGLYADVALRPLHWVTVRGGVRADLFAFDVQDACAVKSVSRPDPTNPPGDDSCLDQQRFGRHREPNQRSSTASTKLMPRASLVLGPFQSFSFSLSYGTGVRSIDPNYITQDADTPFASIDAYEGGVQYTHSFEALSVVARSVFFETHVDRDLAFSETEGRSILGGGTTRTGWTGAVRLTTDYLDENAHVTLVRSAFDDSGLLVPYVPDVVVRSDTALKAKLPVRVTGQELEGGVGSGIGFIGRRALPYGQRSDTIFTVDASAYLALRGYELELSVSNLFDNHYRLAEYNFVSDFQSSSAPTLVPARHFVAGPPRTVLLSFSANFGGS